MGSLKMEKNIYDLLNETTVDLEKYEVKEMSPLEQKRILKQVKEKNKMNKGKYTKYIAVASAAVIGLGLFGSIPTMASINPTAFKLANMLGIEKN